MDYLFDVMASRLDSSSGQDKMRATEALFPFIASMDNPYDQDRYFRRLADLMGVSIEALEASVGRPQRRDRRRSQPQGSGQRIVQGQPSRPSRWPTATHWRSTACRCC